MKRNLHTVDRAVVREADFDGDVEASVIVGVRIEGEGDGKFTLTPGLQRFYAQDPHQMLHGWSTSIPAR